MKLVSFRVKGFKSIIDTGENKLSDTDNITVLAGQNEAGKSAALEALDFFKSGPGPDFVRLQKRMDSPTTEVSCKFLISDEDLTDIKNGFSEPAVDKFFSSARVVEIKRVWNEENSSISELFIPDEYFSAFQFTPVSQDTVTSTSNEFPPSEPIKVTTREDIIIVLKKQILARLPVITLYRYFTDFLPSEIEVLNISQNQAVKDFQKVFDVDLTKVASISDPRQLEATLDSIANKATDDFNKSWSQQLSLSDETKYKFIIRIPPGEAKKIVFMIKSSDNTPLYLEQKSMGFRWFSAFHLRLQSFGVDPKVLNNFVLLVDEPGQNLHEKAQDDAKKVLEELASKGAQILYSTHNAKLIGTEGKEFARIRLVSNSKTTGTKIETVSQFASRSDVGSMDALSPIITAMGLSSIGPFVERDRYNVVVEGISDHYYLSAFKHLMKKEKKLCFIPACGVHNVPNLVSVLIGWGFKYKAVFDDDKDAGRKAYGLLKKEFYENSDELAHDFILKVKDCNGIEDIFSSQDFYKYVLKALFPKDGTEPNSKLAAGKKEILARKFLEMVENEESVTLDKESLKKIEEVFTWLGIKFNLNS